jgi:hypothetical protein
MISRTAPWWMLFSRLVLFGVFQSVFALFFYFTGNSAPWDESVRWWPFTVLLTNAVSIVLLYVLFRKEGKRYFEFAQFHKETIWRDLGIVLLLTIAVIPLSSLPSQWLAGVLLGSYERALTMFFKPLPLWAIFISMAFPITHAFAELPMYFGYAMPRIEQATKSGWFAWGISSLFLALQHITLPLIFDWRFMVWRAGMFLPFAFFMSAVIKLRPRLFPYLMVGHAVIDMMLVLMYFSL